MNNPSLSRKLAGTGLIVLGVLAALGSLNIINFGEIFSLWWPVGLIFAALLIWLADSRQWLWGLILSGFGLLVLVRNLDTGIEFNPFALFWPIVIVALGISLLKNHASRGAIDSDAPKEDSFALLGGVESRSISQDYRGGKATAILGGVDLDLRDAVVNNNAIIDMTVFMGGVTLKVSRDTIVKNNVSAILGGVENKVISTEKHPKHAPTITLVGTVMFGGVEVKY